MRSRPARGGRPQSGVSVIRKFLFTTIRLLVTAGLLWALAARLDLARAGAILAQVSVPLLAFGILTLFLIGIVTAWRWHIILAAEAPSPGPATLAKLVFVGLFFNQVLPSSIGGDAVRALRCRRLGIELGAGIRSILIDRAAGCAVFLLLYAVSLPVLLEILPDPRQRAIILTVFGLGVAGALGLLFFDRLAGRLAGWPLLGQVAALSRASRRLFATPQRWGAVVALSAVAVALNIVVYKVLGDALGSRLPLWSWSVVIGPVTLIQLFPIALAGWGVREVGIVVALSGFGVPAEAALAVSLLFGLCQFAVGLPGGLVWLADWDLARSLPAAGVATPACGESGR